MEDRQENIEAIRRYSEARMRFEADQAEPLLRLGRALADPTRIRILALLAQRSMYGQELAEALEVSPPTISHHLHLLKAGGLISERRENNYRHYTISEDGLQQMAETLTLAHLQAIGEPVSSDAVVGKPSEDDDRALILKTFFKDGRLLSIPARPRVRGFILEKIAESFEWGRYYDEKEINAILKTFHEDTATLRRELITRKLMMRDHGHYWLIRPQPEQ
jgi:ArsR family transcriptional regulator, arsenate/arsenite/antimonite-responsive transcriptional repressor